ncbi:MAG: HypC/HybG/HupF family hydrogenase formation chaperone [Proteobacteria bacterium]|nr:HypC/HybG/HupF family hydrogenase formation chaperone [Pseudomonadota bacterium]
MCIGIPMQVIASREGLAICLRDGEPVRVRTSLIGDAQPGDWLLVFQSDAVERLDPVRAAEILSTLALVQDAGQGGLGDAEAAFALPSRYSQAEITHMSGANFSPSA